MSELPGEEETPESIRAEYHPLATSGSAEIRARIKQRMNMVVRRDTNNVMRKLEDLTRDLDITSLWRSHVSDKNLGELTSLEREAEEAPTPENLARLRVLEYKLQKPCLLYTSDAADE